MGHSFELSKDKAQNAVKFRRVELKLRVPADRDRHFQSIVIAISSDPDQRKTNPPALTRRPFPAHPPRLHSYDERSEHEAEENRKCDGNEYLTAKIECGNYECRDSKFD
jgi:hypothetical protein